MAPPKKAKEPKRTTTWKRGGPADEKLSDLFDGLELFQNRKLQGDEEPVDVYNAFPEFHTHHSLQVFRKHWNDEKSERGMECKLLKNFFHLQIT